MSFAFFLIFLNPRFSPLFPFPSPLLPFLLCPPRQYCEVMVANFPSILHLYMTCLRLQRELIVALSKRCLATIKAAS